MYVYLQYIHAYGYEDATQ